MAPEVSVVEVSVVVPALNEAHTIAASLERISRYLGARPGGYEVLVVDDGSTDATAELVAAHDDRAARLLRQPGNRGKGAALRRGVADSVGRRVLLCDADLSTPIRELERLEPSLEEAGLVLGSRRLPDSRLERKLARRAASWMFNSAVHLMGLCRGVRDTQCGFKLLDGEAARGLFPRLTLDGFAFDLELIELARREGVGVVEVGVKWNDTAESTVRPLRDGAAMLRDALAVRRRLRS